MDLDAATRLASLVPADVGSGAEQLIVWVTDENGFIVRARPASWTAVFGYYTASLRTPELIPGQVRLLRSLLVRPRGDARPRHPRVRIRTGPTCPSVTPEPSPSP